MKNLSTIMLGIPIAGVLYLAAIGIFSIVKPNESKTVAMYQDSVAMLQLELDQCNAVMYEQERAMMAQEEAIKAIMKGIE